MVNRDKKFFCSFFERRSRSKKLPAGQTTDFLALQTTKFVINKAQNLIHYSGYLLTG